MKRNALCAGLRGTSIVLGMSTAVLVAISLGVRHRRRLSEDVVGDRDLVELVKQIIRPGVRDHLVVAALDSEGVKMAGFGADLRTEFEIGSITKTMTGFLLAEAIRRGEVSAQTKLGDLIDLEGSDAASVTLIDLASHHSGLPSIGGVFSETLRAQWRVLRRRDPYVGMDVAKVLDHGRNAVLSRSGFSYSNLGYALLGHALASAAKTNWSSLVSERIFNPMKMETARVPLTRADLEGAPSGWTWGGRRAEAWLLEGYAPAGGIRASLADMVAYARFILAGEEPVPRMLGRVANVTEDTGIAYAWILEPDGTAWHNGGTGGFSSILLLNPLRTRAIVVMSNTAVEVDSLGKDLAKRLWGVPGKTI